MTKDLRAPAVKSVTRDLNDVIGVGLWQLVGERGGREGKKYIHGISKPRSQY